MKKNEEFQRDSKGDKILQNVEFDFASEMRRLNRTHIFHFKDSNGFFIKVDHDKYDLSDEKDDLPKFTLKEYSLFEHEAPATDQWYRWRNNYDQYLDDFFAPIFRNRMPFGYTSSIDKYDLVLPIEKFNDINRFISEYGLEPHKDFIFYLIAKIEEIYVEDVEYYERPEQKRQIKNFPKEIDKLYNVLKIADHSPSVELNDIPPRLEKITFQYNKGNAIKIEDSLLTSCITKGAIDYFSEGVQKNWEKPLKNFVAIHNENQMPNEFRHRICKALHNFFKYVDAFKFGNANVTEKELDAIAKILDFALVKFHDRKGREFDIEIDLYDIKQNIKNAIKRKELVYSPTHLTVRDIKPDLNLLLKYFDREFLLSGMQTYDQYDLRVVGNIVDRFDIDSLSNELLHIYDCLKHRQYQIGHQFEAPLNKEIEQNEDYSSWRTLLKFIHSPSKFKKVSFFQGDKENVLNFSEELSLELINKALIDYYKRNKFEFENDFYEAQINSFLPKGSFKLTTTGLLNKPRNRFLPIITKQLYNYLLNEVPPTENERKPSDKYYAIIASILMPTFNLGNPLYDEEYIIEKIEQWHNTNN